MSELLGGLGSHVAALLVGGLGTSLGITYGARTGRGQSFLVSLGGWVFGFACLGLVAIGGGTAYVIVQALIEQGPTDLTSVPAGQMLMLGIGVGLPLGLPGVIAAWSEARHRDRKQKKRRDYVPTKDDRREYAVQLVKQIMEVSPKARELTATIAGDGGKILRFEGDIDAKEGERLTTALRQDLRDVGFKRVEGKNGTKEWWSRV